MLGSRWAIVLTLAAACTCATASGQTGFTISGVVVERGSNRPLKHVLVSITPTEHRDVQLSCVTDGSGRFAFTNVPAAKYSLVARKRGEPPEGYHQDEGYATAIAVGPGLDSASIVFPLDTLGSLSGTVLDDQGDPVPQAQVWLFHKGVSSGRLQILLAGTYMTGSSGNFYIGHLSPGMYYVAVQGHPWYAQNFLQPQPTQDQNAAQEGAPVEPGRSLSELDVAYPVTYYGDTSDPASASPITISEGGSATVQITMRPVPAVHVDLTGEDPQPNRGFQATFFTSGPGGYPIPANGVTYSSNNRREITGVAPGNYVVTMQSFGQRGPEPIGTKTLDLTGSSTLDIHDLPKASVTGQVGFEGNERPGAPVSIRLSKVGPGFNEQSFDLPIGSDGSLSASDSNIMPGRYRVQLLNAQGSYVKSVTPKGGGSSGDEFDVREGAALAVSIVVAKGSTRLDGVAVNGAKPVAGAMVLLVPQDLSRTAQFRRDQSDSDGTFSLFEVVPGRYILVAIDNGRDLEYKNPAVINSYLSQGETLDLPLRDHSSAKAAVKVNVLERKN